MLDWTNYTYRFNNVIALDRERGLCKITNATECTKQNINFRFELHACSQYAQVDLNTFLSKKKYLTISFLPLIFTWSSVTSTKRKIKKNRKGVQILHIFQIFPISLILYLGAR